MKRVFSRFIVIFLWFTLCSTGVLAQTLPASQTMGGVIQQEKSEILQKKLEERIEKPRETGQEASPEEVVAPDAGEKIVIEIIRVEGSTLLTEQEISGVIVQYEGRELSFREMQEVADEVTALYRQKGYATSRAYIPPQTIENGILLIRVVEGRVGSLKIKGNEHFKTKTLERNINLQSEGYFDYSALQRSLVYINEHPDRMAKAILVPGKEAGTTDVIIEVEDRFPVHVSFEYDNWGSRYIDKDRYAVVFEHNNVSGNDDKLYLKGQLAENDQLRLGQLRYIYPISSTLEVGAYVLHSEVRSGDEFAVLDSEGTADFYGFFGAKRLIQKSNLDVRANFGFDIKRITDSSLDVQTSRDELRVVKGGIDVDFSDRWGRTIVTTEIDQGLSSIMGAMEDKDPNASRVGAGARFTKGVFNLFRLQPMPWETSLLWKNTAQYTNYRLVATEEFQIGGATSVRGYPPAEFSGDKGAYTSFELSIPFYFISKDARVPFYKQDRWYDALRFVVFWDWAQVRRKAPVAGEEKTDTLQGAGFGVRLNLSEHLAARVEIGYPLGGPTPSDGDHAHPWVEFSYKF